LPRRDEPTGVEVRLPDLGEGLVEAEVVAWLVAPGDKVACDQPLLEVETAKSVVEIPSPYEGIVVRLAVETGEVASVGTPLVLIEPLERSLDDSQRVLVGYGVGTAVPLARSPHESPMGGADTSTPGRRQVLRGARKLTANRFERSRREIPEVDLRIDVDLTDAMDTSGQPRGLLARLAVACMAGLREFPELNASYEEERGAVMRYSQVNLGLVVQGCDGLAVPVVRHAERLDAQQLVEEVHRLVAGARTAHISPSQTAGPTITINNYGALGVDAANPIINHPNAALVGLGRAARRPWVVSERVCVRTVAQLSLSFDHRVCDGVSAAGFLRHVAAVIQRAPDADTAET
jgi:pyruvate/2-oxoglutarate dehydrogenase complex dihydrolipoamide acyltransferase (E2) component